MMNTGDISSSRFKVLQDELEEGEVDEISENEQQRVEEMPRDCVSNTVWVTKNRSKNNGPKKQTVTRKDQYIWGVGKGNKASRRKHKCHSFLLSMRMGSISRTSTMQFGIGYKVKNSPLDAF